MSSLDPLPPPLNRQDFFSRLDSVISEAKKAQASAALLLIEICNLPRINLQSGFGGGDQALANCFAVLQEISNREHMVYRVGGKRFAMILPPLKSPAFVGLALNKVVSSLGEEPLVPIEGLNLKFKIGVALGGSNGGDAAGMLLRSEANLAQAKRQAAAFTLEDVTEDEGRRQELAGDFEAALRSNAFELYYQPKVDLDSGRVLSAESLLRWEREDGFVAPDIAVDIATRSGALVELTKWTLNTALRQQQELERDGLSLKLAVNIPAGLVSSKELGNLVGDGLAIWSVDPEQLILEITETAVIEDASAGSDYLRSIRAMGVGLSIDDFGTGYSSLSYFKQIPAQELKIDRRFIENLLRDEQDQQLIRIIVDIARVFGFSVVAEGIENIETMELLKQLGCDVGQGYYFARPMPVAELTSWLRDQGHG